MKPCVFNRAPLSIDGPYNIQVGIAPQDADGVSLDSSVFDLDRDNDMTDDAVLIGITQQRHGRLALFDAFGPEDQNLNMNLQVEFFDGNNFVLNTDDNCTTYINTDVALNPASTMVSGPTVATPVINGKSNPFAPIVIDALNSSGELDVTYTATDAMGVPLPWFDPASAKAIFGRFRGHDRVIYWQERFQ